MTRREALEYLAALGTTAAVTETCADAAGHAQQPHGNNRYMGPVSHPHLHFCGIHIAKNDPKVQIIAQHYCCPLGEEMHQCLLYDSFERNAKLLGVEYIISDRTYRALPQNEKRYWHAHTYEVLAGGLTAPGMRADEEMKFMKAIITTWGKTWHTWPDPRTAVPMGEPLLMWSAMGDGQINREVIAARDRLLNVNAQTIREARVKEIGLEVPQVALPKTVDTIGRQWTNDGDDTPRRRTP